MHQRLEKIKVLAMDVDGILTNGKIVLDDAGKELKFFDVQDGYGLVLLRRAGVKTAIISARSAKAVTARAKDLKIDCVYQDAQPKLKAFEKMLKKLKVADEEVCFMGDDLPDLDVLKRVGFAVGVPNAVLEIKRICHYITKRS
ncbi:MAG: hypothetical protein A2Z88_06705, partial [Omnitrophica WOR_2 bacterium GWA2_47_8]